MKNLTDSFYELVNDGFIYDEDENGKNMSYGEYVAVIEYLKEEFLDGIIEQITTPKISDIMDIYNTILRTADDDTIMFSGIEDSDVYDITDRKYNETFDWVLSELEEKYDIDYEEDNEEEYDECA